MAKQKKIFKELRSWGIILLVFLGLHLTGALHYIQVGLKQAVIFTGLVNQKAENVDESPLLNTYDYQLAGLNGESTNLQDLKGKTLFINFWATWCPPCVAEMPNIARLYNKIQQEDIVFLLISSDDNPDKVREFLNKKSYDLPVYFSASAPPEQLRSRSIPTTYVISPEGKIVVENHGMANYNNEGFINFLVNL